MYLSAVILISVVLGGVFLYLAIKTLKKFAWFFAWLRGTVGLLFLFLAFCVIWAGYDLSNYSELLDERAVASISFEKQSDQHYKASISYYIDRDPEEYDIYGDQWQIDARIIRWTGVIAAAGAKPGFRLDRLSGRYFSLEDERSKKRSVYSLTEQPSYLVDMWKFLNSHNAMIPGIDASYGSAAYLPMADAASYQLSLSHNGLTAKPVNEIAKSAVAKWK